MHLSFKERLAWSNTVLTLQKKSSKMIGQVAIQRKLLMLMFTLWKNDTVFIENYKVNNPDPKTETTLDSSEAELL